MPYRFLCRTAETRPTAGVLFRVLLALLAVAPGSLASEPSVWEVRVVDEGREPVPGVRATVHPLERREERARRELAGGGLPRLTSARSGRDGWLRISRPTSQTTLLFLRAPGYATTAIPLSPGPNYAGGELILTSDPGMRVRVVDATGQAVAGARVRVAGDGPYALHRSVTATTGEDGWARLARVTGSGHPARDHQETPEVRLSVLPPVGRFDLAPSPRRTTDDDEVVVALESARARTLVVRRPDGRPAAGVLVMFDGDPREISERPLALSDAAGRIVLPQPLAAAPLRLHLVAEDLFWSRVELPAIERAAPRAALPPAPLPVTAPLQVTLKPPTRVHLRVDAAPGGEPVAGAVADWVDRSAVTGADGRASFLLPAADVESWSAWPVQVLAAGFRGEHGGFEQAPGSHEDPLVIRLRRSSSLAGRIVDAEGQAVIGAWVGVRPEIEHDGLPGWIPSYRVGQSGADGAFEFADLATDRALRLRVEAAGFAPAQTVTPRLATGENRDGIKVTLERGRSAFALVLGADGAPIPGATLELTTHATGGGDLPRGGPLPCTAEGRCPLDDLSPGRFDLRARAPGHAATTVRGVEVPKEADVPADLGVLYLEPTVAITGRVTDAVGAPLAGADVRAERVQESGGRRLEADTLPRTRSGADGRFRLDGLAARQVVHLVVDADGYAVALVPTVEAPRDDVEAVLQAAASVAGLVVDGEGRPLGSATLRTIQLPEERISRHLPSPTVQTDEEGRFELTELPPGALRVEASDADHQGSQDLRLEPGEERRGVRLEVRSNPASPRVSGRVVDDRGAAITGADIELKIHHTKGSGFSSTRTGTDGRFDFELWTGGSGGGDTQPWQAVFEVDHPDYLRHRRELDLGGLFEDTPMEIVLTAGGTTVSGVVVDEGGVPVSNARVSLEDTEAHRLQSVTGMDGAFRFEGVEPATWHLWARHPEWMNGGPEEPLLVDSTAVEGLRIVLERGAVLRGRVTGAEPRELTTVQIQAGTDAGARHDILSGQPDHRGEFALPGARPGTWQVNAGTADGLREVRVEVEVRPGDREVEVELDLGGGSYVTGVLMTNGRPRPGVSLSLRRTDTAYQEVTDQDGRFRFRGVEDGEYALMSWAPPLHRAVTVRGDTELRLEVELAVLAGTFVDEAGEPLTATLKWTPLGGDAQGGGQHGGIHSFHIEVPPGPYGLRAWSPGYLDAEMRVDVGSATPTDDLRLTLRRDPREAPP